MSRHPVKLPPDLVAIAIDTNATGGDFSLAKLSRLAELLTEQEMSAKIWIPEPVIWEWAEHAHSKLVAIRNSISQLAATGLPGFADLKNLTSQPVNDVVAAIETQLEGLPAVTVLRLEHDPAAAVNGLRDQVLQTGAGRRKEAGLTKTGAADSTSFRLIQRAAGESLEDFVALVSKDRDTSLHFGDDPQPIVISDWNLLERSILAAVPSEQEVNEQVTLAICRHLEDAQATQRLRYDDLEGSIDGDDIVRGGWATNRVTELERFAVPATVDELSRKEGFASVTVPASIAIDVEYVWYDHEMDQVEQQSTFHPGLVAELRLLAEQDSSGGWDVSVSSIYLPAEGSKEATAILDSLTAARRNNTAGI